MGDLAKDVIAFFEADDWPYQQLDDDATVLQTATQGASGAWNCFVQIREAQAQVIFYSVCPVTIPKPQRTAIAEFLTRANSGMVIGNFEIDLESGQVRYKTSIDVAGDQLSHALMHNLTYANVLTMDEYLPGLMAVLADDTTPKEAIAAIESSN
ncbi:MAG: YbjN domain-containing protein [Anaerolineae bacterium]|nr:YbjN domain-containing protein [Anaerolineae bacterium]